MNTKKIILSAMLLTGALAAGMPAQADPPPWAPAHGRRAQQEREYKYVYYPAQQVYYAPASGSWFWLNGGNWQVGVNLPTRFQATISSGSSIQVALHSDRPYVEHVYVEEHYGRPWREKHKHPKFDRDDDRDGHRDHGHGGHGRHGD